MILRKPCNTGKLPVILEKSMGLQKPVHKCKHNYGENEEFLTRDDLDYLSLDLDAMRMQSLMICERILGIVHKDMIYRLMYRGAAYADSLQYQQCIDLWKYALELRVIKDSILFCDTWFTAQALVKLYLDLYEKNMQGILSTEIKIHDVISTIELLVADLPRSANLLTIAPQFKKQQESYDKVLRIITHLLHLVTKLPSKEDADIMTRKRIHLILSQMDPRTTNGDSLLHLSVMKNNTLKNQNLFEDGNYSFFPSYEVTKLLLECGAKVNAINSSMNNTPLHTASMAVNYRQEVVFLNRE